MHRANASLPLGEMPRSGREGLYQLFSFSGLPDTNLLACCPLSHLLRKCQLSQRESREVGANRSPITKAALSGGFCRIFQSLRSK